MPSEKIRKPTYEELEAKLRESQAKLESARIEQNIRKKLTQGVLLVRKRDNIIIYADAVLESLFQYDHGELVGKHIKTLNFPGSPTPDEVYQAINQQLDEHGKWQGVLKNQRKDGSIFYCNVSTSSFMHEEHGKSWISIHEDVTSNVETKKALESYQSQMEDLVAQKTNALLRSLVESVSELVIFALDTDLRYTVFNQAHASLIENVLGHKIKIGDCVLDYIPENDRVFIKRNFDKALKGERIVLVETYPVMGEMRHYKSFYNPIFNSSGEVTGLTAFVSDISDQIATQEKIKRQGQTFIALLENSPDSIIRMDSGLKFVYANPAFENLCRVKLDGLVGKSCQDLQSELGPLKSLESQACLVLEEGQPQKIELSIQRNGKQKWYQAHMVPEMNADHAVEFVLCILRDITEIKNFEKSLKQAQKELEKRVEERTNQLTIVNENLKREIDFRQKTEEKLRLSKNQAEVANNAKSEFLANVSHELRTPMHHILNYSKFGIEKIERPKEKLLHYFSQIRTTSQRLMVLLNELLDVSKLESGIIEYHINKHNLIDILSECLHEMKPLIDEKKIKTKIKPFLEQPIAECDNYRIGQVLRNLLSNAIKYSPEAETIEISFGSGILYESTNPVTAIKVSIADRGIGIPTNEMQQIFEQFVQSSLTKTGAGGTGLGLTICRKIIEDHKGRIWAANNKYGGAVLSFLIPLNQNNISS